MSGWDEVNHLWIEDFGFDFYEADTFRKLNDVLPEDTVAVPLYAEESRVMVLRWRDE